MDSCQASVASVAECLNNNYNKKSFFSNQTNMMITLLCIGIITFLFFTTFNFKKLIFSSKDLALIFLLFAFLFYVNGYEKTFILSVALFLVFYFVPTNKLDNFYQKYLEPYVSRFVNPRKENKTKESKETKESFKNPENKEQTDVDDDSSESSSSSNEDNYEITIDDPVTSTTIQEEVDDENVVMDISKRDNERSEVNVDALLTQLQNEYLNK